MVHSSSQHAELAQEVLQPLQDEDSSFSMIVRDAGRFQRMGSLKSSKTDVIVVIIIGYVRRIKRTEAQSVYWIEIPKVYCVIKLQSQCKALTALWKCRLSSVTGSCQLKGSLI